MKKVKGTNEAKTLTRDYKTVRVLSSGELQYAAGGGDDPGGGKRPV